jgi:hypothetical protein
MRDPFALACNPRKSAFADFLKVHFKRLADAKPERASSRIAQEPIRIDETLNSHVVARFKRDLRFARDALQRCIHCAHGVTNAGLKTAWKIGHANMTTSNSNLPSMPIVITYAANWNLREPLSRAMRATAHAFRKQSPNDRGSP